MMTRTREISVQYYAVFREQRGLSAEIVQTQAATLADLYTELKRAHQFSLPLERVQVAVNDEFCEWHEALPDRATVVFIPPVAGG